MVDRDGRAPVGWEIQVDTIQAIKEEAQKRGMSYWEFLDQMARDSLGLDDASTEAAYRRNIERLEGEVSTLEEDIERKQQELEKKQDQLEFYEDGLNDLLNGKESYSEQLETILDSLEDSPQKRVAAFRADLREAATDQYGRPTEANIEQVREDLEERAMTQDRDILEHQFSDATGSKRAAAVATDGRGSTNLSSLQKAREGKLGEKDENSGGDC